MALNKPSRQAGQSGIAQSTASTFRRDLYRTATKRGHAADLRTISRSAALRVRLEEMLSPIHHRPPCRLMLACMVPPRHVAH